MNVGHSVAGLAVRLLSFKNKLEVTGREMGVMEEAGSMRPEGKEYTVDS